MRRPFAGKRRNFTIRIVMEFPSKRRKRNTALNVTRWSVICIGFALRHANKRSIRTLPSI
jgi:hypothetical protein